MNTTNTCPNCGATLESDAPAGLCPRCLMNAALADSRPAETPESRPTTLASGFIPPEPDELALLFPHLEIIELIGRGGMGAVYKARQPGLDRLVAIKILPPEVAADPAFAERFAREARALAKLSHQNIVSVYDFGQVEGQFYFMMEYVDGTNLRQLIETQTIGPEEALAIVPQICEALQFAHNEGIVHRDIKPENILLDKQGRVKIADFGLAKLLGKAPAAMTLTAAHQVMGTLHYMAPEQMRGAGNVDHRADIYSLGVVFYEMLTGQLPIGRFEPPSRKVQVDVRLDEVVLRALENEPEKRYQRASELKHDTEQLSSAVPALRYAVQGLSGPAGEVAPAARKLRGPMAALFLVGLVQFLASVVLITWLGMTLARIYSTPETPETTHSGDAENAVSVTVEPHAWWPYEGRIIALLIASCVSATVGLLAMAAAVCGSRLQLEGFLRVVCILVCLPSPVWPFGLAAALVAFSVMGRPNVRAAFAAVAAEDETPPRPSILNRWSVWTVLELALAILVMAASLIPWVRINIFGFAFTGLGIEHWHGIVVAVAAGLATILVAAFATWGGSRLGQGLSACLGGLIVCAAAGYFAWEVVQPLQAETSATVTSSSGDESWDELGNDMADSLGDFFVDSIGQQSAFGSTAAIVCGVLLALVGAGQLVGPLVLTASAGDRDADRRRLRGLGEAFIVIAGISLLTAIGVGLWLRFVPNASLLSPQTRTTLQMMSATHAIYGACVLTAGVLMLKRRARLVVLLISTIVGIAIPAMLALNVIMEWGHVPQWPVMIPVWLGVPLAVWATFVLFRQDVRDEFQPIRWSRNLGIAVGAIVLMIAWAVWSQLPSADERRARETAQAFLTRVRDSGEFFHQGWPGELLSHDYRTELAAQSQHSSPNIEQFMITSTSTPRSGEVVVEGTMECSDGNGSVPVEYDFSLMLTQEPQSGEWRVDRFTY